MARSFPGAATNYLSLGTAPSGIDGITGTLLTVTAMIKPSVAAQTQVFSHDVAADRQFVLGHTVSGSNWGIDALIGDGGSNVDNAQNTPANPFNQWAMITMVKNGTGAGALKGYINGTEVVSITSNLSIGDSNATCAIGSRNGASNFYGGLVQEVAIWVAALTPAEIVSLTQGVSPLTIQPTLLRGYWPLCGTRSPEPDLLGVTNATIVGSVPAADHGYVESDYCAGGLVSSTERIGRGSAW